MNQGSPLESEVFDLTDAEFRSLVQRYDSSYTVARFMNGVGKSLRVLAGVLGILALAGTPLIKANSNLAFALAAVFILVVVFILLWAIGLLISSAAEIHIATLDTAVCGNPFLSREDIATIMNLR